MPVNPQRVTSRILRSTTLIPMQSRPFSKFDRYGNSPIPANKQRFVPTSGTYPKGFLIGSTNVGIKPSSRSQPDLILVASERPSCGAAVLTKNEFAAPSVTVTREILQKTKGHGIRGIIANSWCANLLTGKAGIEDSIAMSKEASKYVSGETQADDESSVMIMHTGLGGQRLPLDDIIQGLPQLHRNMGNSHQHWFEAAWGILTTDTFPKLASRTFTLPSSPNTTFSIAGITKGAGMIHPNMATTLGIICTDAAVTPAALQQLLRTAADKSYNCISIEGDTSTNDMVAMLANGAAVAADSPSPKEIDFAPDAAAQSPDFIALQRTLIEFMADLAKLVVRDGEGASKFIAIRVRGAPSYAAGKHMASVIARSVLFKTGIYGKDPNWGGALVALGYSLMDTEFAGKGVLVPESTSITFLPVDGGAPVKFWDRGEQALVDEGRAKEIMEQEDIEVLLDLRDDGSPVRLDGTSSSDEEAVYWTCDLTHDFVTINGDFRN